jgi:two-component system, chemotaxis family, chemotaxis protein CheY
MKKALVVDDSRAMRTILSQSLKEAGFADVSQAANGREGYEFLVGHPDTELCLVDWNMPEMTGIQMVEAVRKEQALGSVRIMMVTTETEAAHMQRAIEAGANEYVMKPFTKDVIAQKLRVLGF